MRKVLLGALFILGFSTTALSETISYNVLLNPFTIVQADLNLPDDPACEREESRTFYTIECTYDDATFVLDNGSYEQTIRITESTKMVSEYDDRPYSDTYYKGVLTVDGTDIRVNIAEGTRGDVIFPGDLRLNGEQSFTIMRR